MRLWGYAFLVALIVAPVCAEEVPEVVLPVASSGTGPADRVVLTIDSQGHLRSKETVRTLDELTTILDNAKRGRVEIRRAEGLADLKRTDLTVLLRVHKDAPWLHVQWVMTVMAEQKVHKLRFAVRRTAGPGYSEKEAKALGASRFAVLPATEESTLNADLPADPAADQVERYNVGIHIVPRLEDVRTFGPPEARVRISMPIQVRYRFGDRETGELESVAGWIADGKKAAAQHKLALRGEIKAGNKVPFKFVVAVLNKFREADVDRV
ncbi:MAG: ExbD/TolR family protein, partial [Planctomycetota bacterium]